MGQVHGTVQGFSKECEWISIEEQENRFRSHKLADVYLGLGSEHIRHELFDHEIAHLIADYARMDDNWLRACQLIGQDKVPAFPEEHISEIGDPDSVFYFIPAGSLNELEDKMQKQALAILGLQYPPACLVVMCRWDSYNYSRENKVCSPSHGARWALMKRDFLKGSQNKDYYEQRVLAKAKGVTFPSLHIVAKILLLDNALQLYDSVQKDEDVRVIQTETALEMAGRIKRPLFSPHTYTRVKESSVITAQFLIGFNNEQAFLDVVDIHDSSGMDSLGLSVVREF